MVYVNRKYRGNRSTVYWGAIILDWFEQLNTSGLNKTDYRTMFFICSNIDIQNNTAYLKQVQIADGLHTDKGNISKSIKHLIDLQFITKVENGFMVNPHLFYVGKARAGDRYYLREEFDGYLEKKKEKRIYEMDEESGTLIVHKK